MRTQRVLAAAVFALVMICPMFSPVVSAHHSRAGYDSNDKETMLKGVVTEYKWRNPHVFIVWGVKDNNGKVVQWTGELSSLTTMLSEGMTRDSVKVGDEIIVTAIPAKGGLPQSLIRKVVKPDGSIVVDMTRRNIREP